MLMLADVLAERPRDDLRSHTYSNRWHRYRAVSQLGGKATH